MDIPAPVRAMVWRRLEELQAWRKKDVIREHFRRRAEPEPDRWAHANHLSLRITDERYIHITVIGDYTVTTGRTKCASVIVRIVPQEWRGEGVRVHMTVIPFTVDYRHVTVSE